MSQNGCSPAARAPYWQTNIHDTYTFLRGGNIGNCVYWNVRRNLFDMAQKIFNIVIIGTSCIVISFLCAVFFLGTKGTFEELKQDFVQSFALRALGGIVLGLPTLVLLVIGNLIFNLRTNSEQKIKIGKLLIISIMVTSTAAILGTAFFFAR